MLGKRKIAIIGSGTMGRALVAGLLRSGKMKPGSLRATARTKASAEKLHEDLGVPAGTDNADAARRSDVVVLCVKPKDVVKVVEGLRAKGALSPTRLLVSIAAGVSTGILEGVAGPGIRVVRAMPNTPCFIGKGVTVVCRGSEAGEEDAAVAREIFSTMGRALELEEKHMNTVTGLSASGPAFIYLILEALADGGVMRGLPRAVACELAAAMTAGAAEMVLQTGRHPASLKDDVTTPAGCTIAGILVLEDGKIRSVLARGIETAARVAGELGT